MTSDAADEPDRASARPDSVDATTPAPPAGPSAVVPTKVRLQTTIIASLWLFAFVIVRLVTVSYGNPVTAVAVLRTIGPTQVAVGSLIQSVSGMALPAVILLLYLSGAFSMRGLGIEGLRNGLLVVALFLTQIVVLIFVVLALIYVVSKGKGSRIDRVFRRALIDDDFVRTLGSVLVITLMLLNLHPWLPAEQINVGGKTLVGYVLAQDDRSTTVLLDKNRLVTLIATTDVKSRNICETDRHPEWFERSLFDLEFPAAHYPRCAMASRTR